MSAVSRVVSRLSFCERCVSDCARAICERCVPNCERDIVEYCVSTSMTIRKCPSGPMLGIVCFDTVVVGGGMHRVGIAVVLAFTMLLHSLSRALARLSTAVVARL